MSEDKILVIGSACVDVIINVDHIPASQEDIHPFSHRFALGGCAGNVAVMAKLIGADVTLATPVGTGLFGDFVEKELTARDIPIYIRRDEEAGCCYCLVEPNGERTFMSVNGTEYIFSEDDMQQFEDTYYKYMYVCGLEIEERTGNDLITYLERHRDSVLMYAPNSRGVLIEKEKTDRILALSPILHLNEFEAAHLSGLMQYEDAVSSGYIPNETVESSAAYLNEMTGNTVIITLGRYGAYIHEAEGERYYVPKFDTEVVNTIGAGDAHAGAVLSLLAKGLDMRQTAITANKAAAAVVSVESATLSKEQFEAAGIV